MSSRDVFDSGGYPRQWCDSSDGAFPPACAGLAAERANVGLAAERANVGLAAERANVGLAAESANVGLAAKRANVSRTGGGASDFKPLAGGGRCK